MNKKEEALDLVDKNDKVIGSIQISKANSDPKLIHREVAVIVYDSKNKVLIQQRSFTKRLYPGVWTVTCAGHVTKGLTPLEAAHMELKEEVGFDTKLEFIEKEFHQIPTESRFFYWYLGKFPKKAIIKMERGKVINTKFISKSETAKFQKSGNIIGKHSLKYLNEFWSGKLIPTLKNIS